MSRACLVEQPITMRNPYKSDALFFFFFSRRVVNLFQELKPKCSHRDFEKGEAAEHNSKKNVI